MEEVRSIKPTADRIKFLLQKGLIDDSGYRKKMIDLLQTAAKFIKGLQLNPREEEDFNVLKQIGSDTGLDALDALSSAGAQALSKQGLHLVSSPTQLANGTLVWSLDPNYRSANGWGLGFFPNVRMVRRMTPNQVDLGVRWGKPGSMDVKIKSWKGTEHSSDLEFYDKAMQWAAENIDFEDVKLKPEPESWKYYTKSTTASRKPFNQEVHELNLQVDRLSNLSRERRISNPIQSINFAISAWTTKKKIAEIEKDADGISHAEEIIARLQSDIEKLKNRNL
jgi:hypothetical protein